MGARAPLGGVHCPRRALVPLPAAAGKKRYARPVGSAACAPRCPRVRLARPLRARVARGCRPAPFAPLARAGSPPSPRSGGWPSPPARAASGRGRARRSPPRTPPASRAAARVRLRPLSPPAVGARLLPPCRPPARGALGVAPRSFVGGLRAARRGPLARPAAPPRLRLAPLRG